jgi:hypothetical protein
MYTNMKVKGIFLTVEYESLEFIIIKRVICDGINIYPLVSIEVINKILDNLYEKEGRSKQ